MARICDDCGDSFTTLTRLRLHDCPGSGDFIQDAIYPVPRPENLPERAINTAEYESMQNDARIDRVEKALKLPLPGDSEALAFVVETEGQAYALHSDHSTGAWSIVEEGSDFDEVKSEFTQWLSEDIGKVTGGAPNPKSLESLDVPDDLETDCTHCGGTHVVEAQPESATQAFGMYEYEGVCDDTGELIVVTKPFDEFQS